MVKPGTSRLRKLFFCTCGKLSTSDYEDDVPYIRNTDIDEVIEYQRVIEEYLENKQSETESLLPAQEIHSPVDEPKTTIDITRQRPRRPDTLRWSIIPHPEQVLYRHEFQQILAKLNSQSVKLDSILKKIDNQDKISSEFQSEVDRFKVSIQLANDRISILDSEIESQSSNRSNLPSISKSRTPKEHDDFSSAENSAEVAEIISDQLKCLKRCAVEHNNNQPEDDEISEMMSQMESDMNRLPVYSAQRNRDKLRSPNFQRTSHPSPLWPENIELDNLSPRCFSEELKSSQNFMETST